MGGQETSYRISQAKADSPVADLHIEPMIDFLIYDPLELKTNLTFESFIISNENKEMPLTLYIIASQTFRKEKIVPRKWKGDGLLGFRLIKEDYKLAHTRVIRVLKILMNSPLHKAGFKPLVDYIISTTKTTFDDIETFNQFIKENDKKEVELVVYSSKEGKTRVVKLVPNSDWGGSGYLGGEIGFGHLHSIPVRKSDNVQEDNKEEKSTNKTTEAVETSADDIKTSKKDIVEEIKKNTFQEDKLEQPLEKKEEVIKESVKEEPVKEEPIIENKEKPTEQIKEETPIINKPLDQEDKSNIEVEKAIEVTPQVNNEDAELPAKQEIEPEKAVEVTKDLPVRISEKTSDMKAETKATFTSFDEDIMI